MKAKLLVEEASRQKRAREESDVDSSEKSKIQKNDNSKRKGKKSQNSESTSVYLGHIPHGFYEKEMKSFFSQFGTIVKLKHFRNPKTKRSRGYAFIKFESNEVASEVCNTINGYFLHDRKLVCELIPVEKEHDGMYLPPKRTTENEESSNNDNDDNDNEDQQQDEEQKTQNNESKKKSIAKSQMKKQKKLQKLGINYNILESLHSNSSEES